MKSTVIVACDEFNDPPAELEALCAIAASVRTVRSLADRKAREMLSQADALMVSLLEVSAEQVACLKRCRIISCVSVGFDGVDVAAATERGIWVTHVPDYAVEEVATHTLALLLAHARRIPRLLELTRRGFWDSRPVRPVQRLQGQTLGLLGFGRIGRAVAAKGRALGLEVIAYDPYVETTFVEAAGARAVDFETLLQASDFLSLHVPLSEATRRLINAEALARMKPTAFLINTARGALIDEDALLKALQSGQIAGAALDVLSVEPPPPDHPLLHEPRAMVTPHSAWCSEEAEREVWARAAEDVVRVLQGEQPRWPVNWIEAG